MDASDAHFGGALMTETEFHGCRLMGTNFERSRGLGMLLQSCNLYAANLNGCALANAALTGLRLTGASLRGADLRDKIFGLLGTSDEGGLSGKRPLTAPEFHSLLKTLNEAYGRLERAHRR